MRKRQICKMTALLLSAALCAGCGRGDTRTASDGTAQAEADNGQEGTAVDTAESTKADGGKTAAPVKMRMQLTRAMLMRKQTAR